MKRLTPAQLEAKSAAAGVPLEIDPETNTAHLRIGRDEWYAQVERQAVDS